MTINHALNLKAFYCSVIILWLLLLADIDLTIKILCENRQTS